MKVRSIDQDMNMNTSWCSVPEGRWHIPYICVDCTKNRLSFKRKIFLSICSLMLLQNCDTHTTLVIQLIKCQKNTFHLFEIFAPGIGYGRKLNKGRQATVQQNIARISCLHFPTKDSKTKVGISKEFKLVNPIKFEYCSLHRFH